MKTIRKLCFRILVVLTICMVVFQVMQSPLFVLADSGKTASNGKISSSKSTQVNNPTSNSASESTVQTKSLNKKSNSKTSKANTDNTGDKNPTPSKSLSGPTGVAVKGTDSKTNNSNKQKSKVGLPKTDKKSISPKGNVNKTSKNPVKSTKNVTELKSSEPFLTLSKDGKMIYHGQPIKFNGKTLKTGDVFAPTGKTKVPSKLDKMLERGIKVKPTSSIMHALVMSPMMHTMSASQPDIQYHGRVSYTGPYGYTSTVGDFAVNGHQAFCFVHPNKTPTHGVPFHPLKPYNNQEIARTLYYGWNGPGNIFGNDRRRGIVVTSLVISRIYNNQYAGGQNIRGYSELWDKAKHGSLIDNTLKLVDPNTGKQVRSVNLKTFVKSGKQVSQTLRLVASSKNYITVNPPGSIKVVNDSTSRSTSGSIRIYGGQRFHFEATLSYSRDYNGWKRYSAIKKMQPLIAIPDNSGYYQTLGYGHWYTDPAQYVQFSMKFYPRTIKEYVHLRDEYTGKIFQSYTRTKTIGQHYSWCVKKNQKDHEYLVDSSSCQSGTTPDHNYTLTFNYNTKWNVYLRYRDSHNGHIIKNYWNVETRWAGDEYSVYTARSLTSGDTHYKLNGGRHFSGKMPRRNVYLTANFTPYNHLLVNWENKYSPHYMFQQVDKWLKVGQYFKYDNINQNSVTGEGTYYKNGNAYDRYPEHAITFAENMPYNNQNYTFQFRLRRDITVNYYDIRTGQKIKPSKRYYRDQGDHYSESHPTIKKGGLTYHYVKETGSTQSGTIGANNVTINYYYNVPLAKIGLDKLQIYTAPADKGLPVKVYLNKKLNYDDSYSFMKNKDETVTVSLYKGPERLVKKTYTADSLPDHLTFTVPAKGLTVDHHKPYTVKIEGYNPDNFKIESGRGRLTTNGYTSSEETFHVDVTQTQHKKISQVIMTEITPTTKEKDYHETYNFTFTKAPTMKTGYGYKNDISLTYTNELGNNLAVRDMTYIVPQKLIDSYLSYPVSNGQAHITMDKARSIKTAGRNEITTVSYEMPHINIERQSGALFSDQQVKNHDPRINHALRDGHHKFYLPIWMDLGTYSVSSTSKNIGVNQINIVAADEVKVDAYMIATMGSKTIEKDEILMEPVNPQDPFPNGPPPGWTKADIKWIKKGAN